MTSTQIDDLIKKHSAISHALSKQYFGGTTVRDLYTKSSSEYSKKLDLDEIGNYILYPELENFLFNLSQIEENYKKFEDENYSWKNRKNFSQRSPTDRIKIKEILEEILSKSKNCIILSDKQNQDTLISLVDEYSQLNSKIIRLDEKNTKNYLSIKKISATHDILIPTTNLDETIKCVDAGMILWNKFRDYNKINQITQNHIVENSLDKQMDLLSTFSENEC